MRKELLGLAALAFMGCTSDGETVGNAQSAIKYGELDGNRHPQVVLILMEQGGKPAFRCSGTLINATTVLTAGHCTGEPGEFSGMRIFTESDVQNGNNNYPLAGPNSVEASAWFTHPKYASATFAEHDVGIIKLASPVVLDAAQYGVLPTLDQLEALQPRSSTEFTAVGYGVQRINPAQSEKLKIRMFANPYLLQINTGYTGTYSLLLSNNASSGGTCFGDSGGPNFLGTSNVVAGVTSFAMNGTCGGTGGVFRVDRADVLEFIRAHIN